MKDCKTISKIAERYINAGITWLLDEYGSFYGKSTGLTFEEDSLGEEFMKLLIDNIEKNSDVHHAWYSKDYNRNILWIEFTTNVKYFENELENNNEYEVSHYYFQKNKDLFLCKLWQNINVEDDRDVDIASTTDDYELEDLQLDEDSIISKKEFEILYKKLKNQFKIDMF